MTTLVITDAGSQLGKAKERFKITYGMSDKPMAYVAANRVEGIILDARTSITSGAFDLIRSYGITVIWREYRDDGMILIPFNSHGSVEVRKAQYTATDDARGLVLATHFAYAAGMNKKRMLQQLRRYRPQLPVTRENIKDMDIVIAQLRDDREEYQCLDTTVRQKLMNFEAQVARVYWDFIDAILSEAGWEFSKRSRMPAENPFNALLNYGYAVLRGKLTESVAITGLDIYAGYLHTDRSGRESLILDIMEEFRQVAVDSVCLRLVISGQLSEEMFEKSDQGIEISNEVKEIYLQSLIGNFNRVIRSRKLSKWWIYQARRISSFLRGQEPTYSPYLIQVKDEW